jgi:hypothetical protein
VVSRFYPLQGQFRSSWIAPVNMLPRDKQIAVISALTEGCSIRATERLTGIHRDTIMRLGVRVGDGCTPFRASRQMQDRRTPADIFSSFNKGGRHADERRVASGAADDRQADRQTVDGGARDAHLRYSG